MESLPDARYKAVPSAYEPGDGLMVAAGSDSNSGDDFSSCDYYAVQQMKFPKKGEKGTIVYNHWHTVTNIPPKAYEYVVNGKSAINVSVSNVILYSQSDLQGKISVIPL